MAKRSKLIRRLRRSVLAIGLIVYAHAMLGGAVALIIWAPSHQAGIVGASLLAAMFTLVAVSAGAVMGNRLHQDETPLPPIADIDRQLSGDDDPFAEEIQEQMDRADRYFDNTMPASFGMTAPESRNQ